MKHSEHIPPSTFQRDAAEELLVRQAIAGEQHALEKLYELFYPRLVQKAYQKVQNFEIAEQLVQDTFLQVIKHIDSYEEKGRPFYAWLSIICDNLIKNYFRSRNRKDAHTSSLDAALFIIETTYSKSDTVPSGILQQELLYNLLKAIEKLPTDQRQVVKLKLESDWQLSNQEIAKHLGKSEQSVKSLYFRAIQKLKGLLDDYLHISE